MVKSFGVPPEDISYYAGITAASFSLSQFVTGIAWGRLSDKVGRKPVIIIGLLGTLTSLLIFVLSIPFPLGWKQCSNDWVLGVFNESLYGHLC
jgi:MFS family permease